MEDFNRTLAAYSSSMQTFWVVPFYIGLAAILIYALKFARALVKGLRLYLLSLFKCSQSNLAKHYGRWALVTGATDGIGLSIARELARRGMSILVVSRNAQKLAATKLELQAIAEVGEVETVQIDLADSSLDNFRKLQEQINPDARDIGLLVNNAGLYPDEFKRVAEYNMEHLLNIANLNMLHPLHMSRMVIPGMLNRGRGLVINVSSIWGTNTTPCMSIYGPTKSFLNAFTRQLQMEYAREPIDIILLEPGMVQTRHLDKLSRENIPSWFSLDTDYFARSTIRAISATRASYSNFSGALEHEILRYGNLFMLSLNLAEKFLFPIYLRLVFGVSPNSAPR